MGNRAVLSIGPYSDNAIGIYLHWNGGRDSIEGFLAATKSVMESRGQDAQYAPARLVQVIGNFFGGNTSVGLGLCKDLDCDNYDNGVYEIDPQTMTIIGRKFHKGDEQQEYELHSMTQEILDAMPSSYQVKIGLDRYGQVLYDPKYGTHT